MKMRFLRKIAKNILPYYFVKKYLHRASPAKKLDFSSLTALNYLYLYAGDIPRNLNYQKIGLSISKTNDNHIQHDITNAHNIKDNSVDIYQAEDVFEHIEYDRLKFVIKDIYRILKPNGLFRLSVPDYRCDILRERSVKDDAGNIIFDSYGGGNYSEQLGVINGGHLWFPTFEKINELLKNVSFSKIDWFHYYDEEGIPHMKSIDYTKGYIHRTPDHIESVSNPYRPLSIVVDCYK